MIEAFLRRQPGEPWYRIAWWHFLHGLCFIWFWLCYGFRAWGIHHIPRTGPVLLVSNHQSFLDPIIVGLGSHHRQFYAIARESLWHTPGLGWLISSLNAVPVARGESDLKAMRKCVDVLKRDHALLVFAEGTRTPDGRVQTFQPGTMLLIKRSGAMVVPVALDGAHAAWPRSRKMPYWRGRIGVMYGEPVPAEQLAAMPAEAAMALLQTRIESMRQDVADRLQRGAAGPQPITGRPLMAG
jgi:1-acyl-sn-glycerol-3-phosphate acyltransferase